MRYICQICIAFLHNRHLKDLHHIYSLMQATCHILRWFFLKRDNIPATMSNSMITTTRKWWMFVQESWTLTLCVTGPACPFLHMWGVDRPRVGNPQIGASGQCRVSFCHISSPSQHQHHPNRSGVQEDLGFAKHKDGVVLRLLPIEIGHEKRGPSCLDWGGYGHSSIKELLPLAMSESIHFSVWVEVFPQSKET